MTTPNTPARSINAWTYLDEDDPSGTGYTSPNSSYQSLINNRVYAACDMLCVCFFTTVQDPVTQQWSINIGNATTKHPDGSTTAQYLQYTIRDARAQNPGIKVLATLNYEDNTLSQIFSANSSQWQADANTFAANLKAFLIANQMDGFDIDWEGNFAYSITTQQFQILFTAIRSAFNTGSSQYFYLTLSPASVGNLDATTVNTCFDFVTLQIYGGAAPFQYLSAGIAPQLLAYGAKFEADGPGTQQGDQTANEAINGMAAGFNDQATHYTYTVSTQWRLNSSNYENEQGQQLLFYNLYYQNPVIPFDDTAIIAKAGNPPITQFIVRHGNVVDAIWAFNTVPASGTVPAIPYGLLQHGGNGGKADTINLAAGDAITQIQGLSGVWYGWNVIAQITLQTRNGHTYGPYGSLAGVTSTTPFSHVAPAGQSIVAFSGTAQRVPEATGGPSYVVASLNVAFG